ncbi:MAG: DUF1566 domain-containing protein [Desulfobacteraceae bacterium]|nr:DUF1566 domain-containing protein [Desulfobacteraceae bacterium]MBU4055377.1 DUF1566 domain-containing protein [Pseudomonadota bacterium]
MSRFWKKERLVTGLTVFLLLFGFLVSAHAETDVTTKVQLVQSRLLFDRSTNMSYLDVAVKNISQDVLLSPIKVVIDSVTPADVTVANADGVTAEGKPYFQYATDTGQFLAGTTTANKRVSFYNPKRLRFTYITKVYGKVPEIASVIGSGGGIVEVESTSSPLDGLSLNIPAGSLGSNMAITVAMEETIHFSDDETQDIFPVIDLGPSGTTFSQPVSITIPYSEEKLAEKGIIDESSLRVYTYDEEHGVWLPIQTLGIDTVNNTIAAATSHFSLFAIAGDTLIRHGELIVGSGYNPVLFMHGIKPGLASQNLKGNAYDTFGIAFEGLYGRGINVYALNYDTAKWIDEAAVSLAIAISRIKQETGSEYVNIIAHSMGGLVSRAYLQNMAGADWITDEGLKDKIKYNSDIEKIMMFGTPNHGSWFAILSLSKYIGTKSLLQMLPPSLFLTELNSKVFPPNITMDIVCGYVEAENGDGIVSSSRAILPPEYQQHVFKKYTEHALNGYYHFKQTPVFERGVVAVDDYTHPGYELMLDSALNRVDGDNDGVEDKLDLCPETPMYEIPNNDGCSISQLQVDYLAADVTGTQVDLKWLPIDHMNESSFRYFVSLKRDAEPEDETILDTFVENNFTGDARSLPYFGLTPGEKYFWHVWAVDQNGKWSKARPAGDWWSFATAPDTDGDGIVDSLDDDDDGDGYLDTEDAFPFDPTEWSDLDNDGIGDNADPDDNNNGVNDDAEISIPVNIHAEYQASHSWNYITWDAVPGAVQYKVYFTPTSTTDYGHTGVVPGYTYYYRVAAVNVNGDESDLSEQVPCYVPTGTATGKIPDTGQTTSYTSTFGEDSDYTINPQSYTKLDDNGNDLADSTPSWAMVRDNVTGLIWENKTDDGGIHDKDNTYTWYDPNPTTNGGNAGTAGNGTDTKDFIDALNAANFGGHHDWRLPTVKELSRVVNADRYNPMINTSYFSNTMSSNYWSSTTNVDLTGYAWYVNFGNGYVDNYHKSSTVYVRAVRGGQ